MAKVKDRRTCDYCDSLGVIGEDFFQKFEWTVPIGGTDREVTLKGQLVSDSSPVVNACRQCLAKALAYYAKYVILYEGRPVSQIYASLKSACKRAGMIYVRDKKDGFIYHDLRHTFNTFMRKAGVAESVIMEITGHSTKEMFDRYNTIDEDDIRKAVDQFEGFLANVAHFID